MLFAAISLLLSAAVNGPALGGGTEVVLWCDLVVMGEDASLALPEVGRGLFAMARSAAANAPLVVSVTKRHTREAAGHGPAGDLEAWARNDRLHRVRANAVQSGFSV